MAMVVVQPNDGREWSCITRARRGAGSTTGHPWQHSPVQQQPRQRQRSRLALAARLSIFSARARPGLQNGLDDGRGYGCPCRRFFLDGDEAAACRLAAAACRRYSGY
jgi:hypothetical protein